MLANWPQDQGQMINSGRFYQVSSDCFSFVQICLISFLEILLLFFQEQLNFGPDERQMDYIAAISREDLLSEVQIKEPAVCLLKLFVIDFR